MDNHTNNSSIIEIAKNLNPWNWVHIAFWISIISIEATIIFKMYRKHYKNLKPFHLNMIILMSDFFLYGLWKLSRFVLLFLSDHKFCVLVTAMESWLNLSRNFSIILQQVDRFLALSCALIYNDIVTIYRTIIFTAVVKVLLLLITVLVFVLDQDVQDCDKEFKESIWFNSATIEMASLIVILVSIYAYKIHRKLGKQIVPSSMKFQKQNVESESTLNESNDSPRSSNANESDPRIPQGLETINEELESEVEETVQCQIFKVDLKSALMDTLNVNASTTAFLICASPFNLLLMYFYFLENSEDCEGYVEILRNSRLLSGFTWYIYFYISYRIFCRN